ncbi:MAG TPA: hypothetical protein VMS17_31920 [Gemmataceae bacterium]|nr:hypothetical protein [Gemmataceae bacterium]
MSADSKDAPAELDYSDEDLTHEEWMQFIAYCWRESLNDPREDIYTLEDGKPSHEPR